MLVVASDGVFEKMDEDLVCRYAEDTRLMKRRMADNTQWVTPIALGGQTAPTNVHNAIEENEFCSDNSPHDEAESGE